MRYSPSKDIIHKTFGYLYVLKVFYKSTSYNAWAKCECKCGTIVNVLVYNLRNGNTHSCGCFRKEKISKIRTIHGESSNNKRTILYNTWAAIIQRCDNLKDDNYGGRGITIYPSWCIYLVFKKYVLKYLGNRPSDKHSIDRIDNDGNYEPRNIKWSTSVEQNNNRRQRYCKK